MAQTTDDPAHKEDRRQTENLNRNAQDTLEKRRAADADTFMRYRDAQKAYEQRRIEWQRRVVACEGGDASACRPD